MKEQQRLRVGLRVSPGTGTPRRDVNQFISLSAGVCIKCVFSVLSLLIVRAVYMLQFSSFRAHNHL